MESTTLAMEKLSVNGKKGENSKNSDNKSDNQNSESELGESDFERSDVESEDDFIYSYNTGYLDDTDEDELLEEDMMIMEDYLEHIELSSDENLEDIIAGNDIYDYDALDLTNKERIQKLTTEMEEEEAMMTDNNLHKKIMKSSKKKPVKDAPVDPEIFGQSLQATMAQVPPSLRPGMRAWFEKLQRREENIQKKRDTKEKKKKSKNKNKDDLIKDEPSLEKIDRRLRDFVQDDSITSFEFAPMSKNLRKQVHNLSQAYNLSSKGIGNQDSRHVLVRKTSDSRLPKNRSSIDRYISQMQTNMDDQIKIAQKYTAHTKPKKQQPKYAKKKEIKTKKPEKKKPNGSAHGAIVAHNAAPIGETNVGHRMLAAMGWQQGQALGTGSNGIVAPIEAVIRRDKLGLGL